MNTYLTIVTATSLAIWPFNHKTKKTATPPPVPAITNYVRLSTTPAASVVLLDSNFVSAATIGDVASDSSDCIVIDSHGSKVVGGMRQIESGSIHPFWAKYADNGNLVISNILQGNMSGAILSIATDKDDNIYTAGYFVGTVLIGTNVLTTAPASYDCLLVKWSTNGEPVWAKRYGGTTVNASPAGDSINSVAYSRADDTVVITGQYDSTIDFGAGPLSPSNGEAYYIAKLSTTDGHPIWSHTATTASLIHGNSVKIGASSGNIFVAGQTMGFPNNTIDFGNGPQPVQGPNPLFIVSYSSDGNTIAPKLVGNSASATSIALDASDSVYVTGWYQVTINFGGDTLTNMPPSCGLPQCIPKSVFVVKFDSSFNHVWSHRLTDGIANSVSLSASGYLAVIPAIPPIYNLLATDGSVRWTKPFSGHVTPISSVYDDGDNLSVVGSFSGTNNFGGSSNYISAGGSSDAFIVNYEVASTNSNILEPPMEVINVGGGLVLVAGIQRSNKVATFYYTEKLVPQTWAFLGQWLQYPADQPVAVSSDSTKPQRFFKLVNSDPSLASFKPAATLVPPKLVDTKKIVTFQKTKWHLIRVGTSKQYILRK